jgi:hypothetical protein
VINNFSILFSLLIVGYVVVRAVALDGRRPWFDVTPPIGTTPASESKSQTTARRV